MRKVVGVRFRTAGKVYYFDPLAMEIKKGSHVIVETARGVEYGSLEQIKDNYPKYLLTMDYGNSEQNGIKRLNVLEWLLNMK